MVFLVTQSEKFVEVETDFVLRVFLDRRVEYNELPHGVLYLENAIGRVILVLLTNEYISYLGIADHILDLCLACSGIERNCDSPNAIGSEIDIHAFRHILGENSDVLLNADA